MFVLVKQQELGTRMDAQRMVVAMELNALPAQHLMMAYTLITFEVLHKEPLEITHSPTNIIHTLLKTPFGDITALVARVKKNL